jgi:hypothetical protein
MNLNKEINELILKKEYREIRSDIQILLESQEITQKKICD